MEERVAGVAGVHRSASAEDELDAVGSDVGVQRRHPEGGTDPLDVVDESMEGFGDGIRALPIEKCPDPTDHQEADGDEPMLPTRPRERRELFDDGCGHVGRQVVIPEMAFTRAGRRVAGRTGDHPATVLLAQLHVVGEVVGDQRVDEGVPLGGFAFQADHLGGSWAGDQQLPVAGADEEHIERPGGDTDGHGEVSSLRRR